jgi:chromosome segregation ATPase
MTDDSPSAAAALRPEQISAYKAGIARLTDERSKERPSRGRLLAEQAQLVAEVTTLRADISDRDEALVMVRAAVVKQREEIATLRAALDGLVEAGADMLAALDMVGERSLSSGDTIAWAFARGGVMADLRAALAVAKETP